MKRTLVKNLLLAVLLVLPLIGFAQERPNRADMEQRRKEQNEQVKKDLKLDKKQAAEYDKLMEKFSKQRTEMMEQGRDSGDREAMREKMTKMREDQDKELKALLDDKQYKKYQEIQAERRAQMGQRGGNMGGRGGGR